MFSYFSKSLSLLIVFALITALRADGPAKLDDNILMPWHYTLTNPTDGWQKSEFDDKSWEVGQGGFGVPSTPGSRVGTIWKTNDIWLRQHVDISSLPAKPALYVFHDEDAEVFINGTQVLKTTGYNVAYEIFPLGETETAALNKGTNLIAIHCHQTGGGQFIDVHVIDADHIPSLPRPKRSTTPYKSALITTWGEQLTADNAWTEYPRPDMVRKNWQCLNGNWDYAISANDQTKQPEDWAGKILVPFAIEAKLSGVQRLLDSNETLWYHRSFTSNATPGEHLLLNFEAVDYRCEVFVNGNSVGKHVGGSDPFSFDVSAATRSGLNDLVVRVEDETEASQLRGKQVLNAEGIWYTQVSGIWQTVWLETVPARHIDDLVVRTELENQNQKAIVTVKVDSVGQAAPAEQLRITISDDKQVVGSRTVASGQDLTISIAKPQLWSPKSPHLYNMKAALLDSDGKVIDEVDSYVGIRTVGKIADTDGNLRFTLNGAPIFHLGPLDQGWWPDGLLTPPSDEAMLSDIEMLKKSGFNMIRKHIKVEPRRFYYHCDRLGMLLWQDQPSGGRSPAWTRMDPNPQDAQWTAADQEQYMLELQRMIDNLENHPAIVVWVPFNEAWGQHATMEVGDWLSKRDPSRLVNVASGGNFWPVGAIADHHAYPHPDFPLGNERFNGFIKVVGEFGGHGYPVADHLWDATRDNWGYGGLPKTKQEYRDRYHESMRRLEDLKSKGIAAGVYTQTTDVEGEINGLMTYDRKVLKIPFEELSKIHAQLVD